MRLLRFQAEPGGPVRVGVLADGKVLPLDPAPRGLGASAYPDLEVLERLRTHRPELVCEPAALDPRVLNLLPPVEPPSFRDFYAFEAHVRNARRKRGLEMLPEWYETPVFYFSNPAGISGPGAAIRRPPDTQELDFELEIAVVIGREGSDIPVEEADSYIAGYTLLNDWSARDIQRREMRIGLGPAKGKDFATSIGPHLVTPDELEAHLLPDHSRGNRYALEMRAWVNDEEYSSGNLQEMHWTFAELIHRASRNTRLRVGDLIGSGTVGTGCILEAPEGTRPWLQPGDHVKLEATGLGTLENSILE